MNLTLYSKTALEQKFGKNFNHEEALHFNIEKFSNLKKQSDSSYLRIFCFDEHMTAEFFAEAVSMILKDKNLRSLEIENCCLNKTYLEAISSALEESSLFKLSLASNALGDESMGIVCKLLKNNNSIKELILDCNGITDEGAKILGDYFKTSAKVNLNVLSLQSNGIQDATPLIINNISKLILSYNKIIEVNPIKIEDSVIEFNPPANKPNYIDLKSNKITSLCLEAIQWFFSNNVFLNLTDNPIKSIVFSKNMADPEIITLGQNNNDI